MKLDIKLSVQQFLALAKILDFMESHGKTSNFSRDDKLIKSVMNKVILKIHKKRLELKASIDLFQEKRNTKIPLEYYEAFFLETYLGIVKQNPSFFKIDEYERNVLLIVANELNQKLA